jgi:hypothetical protein
VESQALTLLESPFLHKDYWDKGYTDGLATQLRRERTTAERAWAAGTAEQCLALIFSRLYLLRNQLFHGAAKSESSANRESLNPAVAFLEPVVRALSKVVGRHPSHDWGPLPFTAKDRPGHPPDQRRGPRIPGLL